MMQNPFPNRRNIDLSSKCLTPDEKRWLAHEVVDLNLPTTQVARKYNIKADTLRHYCQRYRDGQGLHGCKGRPALLDSASIDALMSKVKNAAQAQNAFLEADFKVTLMDEAKATRIRRGDNSIVSDISKTSSINYKHHINASTVSGQFKTKVRVEAEADPRNSYSEALLFNAFQSNIDPLLIVNMDATQYFCRNDNEGKSKLVVIDRSAPATTTASSSGEMGIFVKSYVMCSAAGYIGPMVILFAIDSLNDEVCESHEVPGLSHFPSTDTSGFIVFCKTRAGNTAFYEFLAEKVICPWIQKIRSANALDNMWCFFSTDGEYRQIDSLTSGPMIQLFNSKKILQAKHCASYSAKGNALDAGRYFIATKKEHYTYHARKLKNPLCLYGGDWIPSLKGYLEPKLSGGILWIPVAESCGPVRKHAQLISSKKASKLPVK